MAMRLCFAPAQQLQSLRQAEAPAPVQTGHIVNKNRQW